ncbi:MAG: hypothetical protein IJG24_08560 [Selenomonadaceae bacterium]|nr:hypothetical protein [Selenomonadaceae bacterium]
MRPIKFRGRVPDNQGIDAGKIVCGSLLDYGEGTLNCPQFWIRPKDADRNFPVDEDSIAQLVGFDADGREVYEGDFLVNDNGDGFFAELVGAVLTDEGFLHADIPPEILKLKEAQP